jgi:hypothetical protein
MSFMETPLPPTDLALIESGIGRYTLRILFAALPFAGGAPRLVP